MCLLTAVYQLSVDWASGRGQRWSPRPFKGIVRGGHVVEQIESTDERKILGPLTFRIWKDDYLFLEQLSKASGTPVRELCRDLVSEAVQARRQPPVSYEEVRHGLEQLTEQFTVLNRRQEEFLTRYDQNEER